MFARCHGRIGYASLSGNDAERTGSLANGRAKHSVLVCPPVGIPVHHRVDFIRPDPGPPRHLGTAPARAAGLGSQSPLRPRPGPAPPRHPTAQARRVADRVRPVRSSAAWSRERGRAQAPGSRAGSCASGCTAACAARRSATRPGRPGPPHGGAALLRGLEGPHRSRGPRRDRRGGDRHGDRRADRGGVVVDAAGRVPQAAAGMGMDRLVRTLTGRPSGTSSRSR